MSRSTSAIPLPVTPYTCGVSYRHAGRTQTSPVMGRVRFARWMEVACREKFESLTSNPVDH